MSTGFLVQHKHPSITQKQILLNSIPSIILLRNPRTMTNIDSRGGLAVAEIAFFSPAFILAVGVCIKQGTFTRNAGWLYLVILSILRLIGASVTLYMETQNDYSVSLIETAAITSSIGTAPLLLVLMGLLEQLHTQLRQTGHGYSQNIFRPIHLIALVALVLGIVGGTYRTETNNPDNVKTGESCSEAGALLFLAVYLGLAIITLLTAVTRMSFIASTEKFLIIAGVCVLPFVLVRIIYTVAVSFAKPGSTFYYGTPNVYVEAFMMFAMEAIAVIFYTWAGLLTPKATPVPKEADPKMGSNGRNHDLREQEDGYAMPQQGRQQPRQERREKTLGDYRPSRLIMNAIRDRN